MFQAIGERYATGTFSADRGYSNSITGESGTAGSWHGCAWQAVNDDVYDEGVSPVRLVFAVLGNMIGGTLLLSGMFVLPHVLAGLLG